MGSVPSDGKDWIPFPVSFGRADATAYYRVDGDQIEVKYDFPLFYAKAPLAGAEPMLIASTLFTQWKSKVGAT